MSTCSDEESINRYETSKCEKYYLSSRYVLALMGFFGLVNIYAMRVNVSVAIVAMVNSSAIASTSTDVSDTCPDTSGNSTSTSEDGEFIWDEVTQGYILGAFFYGYVVTQIPGSFLVVWFGGKKMLIGGIAITSLLTLLSPLAADMGAGYLIAARIIAGLGEGVTYPATHALLGKWCPPMERSKLTSFVYAGGQFGTVISLALSGVLCSSDFLGGWPSAFYVFGFFGVIWCICSIFLIYDSPSNHPRITDKERQYIINSLKDVVEKDGARAPTPWLSIVKCVHVWAIVITHFGNSWVFYTLLSELPTYMSDILHYDISKNSLLSALPYLVMWLLAFLWSWCGDWIQSKNYLTTLNTRRLFQLIGEWGPSISVIILSYVGCNEWATVLMLVIGCGLNGACYTGYLCNIIDIAPNYAGPILGISNCFGNFPGFLAPLVIGALTEGQETITQWRKVFYLAAIVSIFCSIIFCIFASGKEQEWNMPNNAGKDADDEECEQNNENDKEQI